MRIRVVPLVALYVALAGTVAGSRQERPFTAHEWGTFTTVAGVDGQAQEWLPLGGPTDLPCFVETYENRLSKVLTAPQAAAFGPLLTYEKARSGLKGTVRMETPVLYFYADQPVNLSVSVGFPRGLFTEWYPTAAVQQMPAWANVLRQSPNASATISWPSVLLKPCARAVFPETDTPSHYYAARETDATPIEVNGQEEKFLFYRGVGGFGVPIAASPGKNATLEVRTLGEHALPALVVFTNRGGKIGYSVHRDFKGQNTLAMPPLNRTLADLHRDLAAALVAQGLYAREAEAMISTWRDTWFEEGTRALYIVPKPAVAAMLPLAIVPRPTAIERVFVGRMDVITPAHIADVRRAIVTNNRAALARHGRLLAVIGERILESTSSVDEKRRIEALLNATFAAYVEKVARCD
jgi:hypothetical protein